MASVRAVPAAEPVAAVDALGLRAVAHDGVPRRGAAAAFTVLSVNPPLALVTLPRSSPVARLLDGASFAVALGGGAVTLSCQPWNVYDGGDHVIAVGEITAVEQGPDKAREDR